MKLLGALLAASLLASSQGPATSPAENESAALPVIFDRDLQPRWLSPKQIAALPNDAFPDFELLDQSGRRLERSDLDGRIVVANFFFTGCTTLCPRLRGSMGRVRDAYAGRHDVLLLSHSVTPEADRPPVLAAYAKANRIDGEQWRLLTGARETLDRLAFEGYLVPRTPPGEGNTLHTEWIVLLDRHQHVRGIYNGTLPIEVDWLIRDVAALEGGA